MGEEAPSQEVALPTGPSEAISGPSGSSQLPVMLQKVLLCPVTALSWYFMLDFQVSKLKGLCASSTSVSDAKGKLPTGTLWCLTAFTSILGSLWSVPRPG